VLIAVNKEANRIFTSNVTSHTVTGIDVGGADRRGSPDGKDLDRNPTNWNQVVIPVKTEPHPIAISPDGKEVWVGGRIDGNITIIDAATKKILQTFELPSWRNGDRMAFTPDGKRLLLPNSAVAGKSGGGEVAVLDVATRKEIKRVPIGTGKQMQDLVVAPDGLTAYVAVANENTVAIIDMKTLEVTGRISIGDTPKNLTPEGVAWASGE
jgi:YVTN family beta-propeller protein